MKRSLLIAAIAAIACSCGQTTGYTIKGKIDDIKAPMVYLLDQTYTVLDSAEVTGGKFTFTGAVDEPKIAFIGEDPYDTFATFILENGRIEVNGAINPYDLIHATGTPSNDGFTEFSLLRNKLSERYSAAATEEEREAIIKEDEANSEKTIDSNMGNYFGLMMLSDMSYEMESARTLDKLNRFSSELQNTTLGKEIRKQAEAKKNTEVGQHYIDIVLPNRNGAETALSTYVGPGKYVLVDFWASWCSYCMHEVPYMIDTYNTYHDKGFEIYGISYDRGATPESDWTSALDSNKMNWVQVAAFKAPDNTAQKDYAVTAFPTNFLISPDGIIIAKNLQGEDLKKEIAKYLE